MDVIRTNILASLATTMVLVSATTAAEWPDYRGPAQNGHAEVSKAPLEWSEDKNIAWKTPIPGRAWSSPVILNNQIWVSNATPDGKKLSAVCLDLKTGKIIHDIPLFTPDPVKWGYAGKAQSHGSPSPVLEPGRVYVHFGTYGTACVDTKSGDILWTRTDINTDHYEGAGSSPILWDDLLILTMDGVHSQYAIAVNKNTGKTVWKNATLRRLHRHHPGMPKGILYPDHRRQKRTGPDYPRRTGSLWTQPQNRRRNLACGVQEQGILECTTRRHR